MTEDDINAYLRKWLAAANEDASLAVLQRAYRDLAADLRPYIWHLTKAYDRRIAELVASGMSPQGAAASLVAAGWQRDMMANLAKEVEARFAKMATDHTAYFDNAISGSVRTSLKSTAAMLEMRVKEKGLLSFKRDLNAFGGWEAHNARAFAAMAAATQPGTALADLLGDAYGKQSDLFSRMLMESIGTGMGTIETARYIARELEVPFTRAATIVRTETLRAMRAAQVDSMMAAARDYGVDVQGYIWKSGLNEKTCAACWALHGTIYYFGEIPAGSQQYEAYKRRAIENEQDHPNGRCRFAPYFGGGDSLEAIRQRERAWNALSAGQKERVLGPTRLRALDRGDIKWENMVARVPHPRWGTTVRVRSLREMGLKREMSLLNKRSPVMNQVAATGPPANARLASVVPLPGSPLPQVYTLASRLEVPDEVLDDIATQANLMWEKVPELRWGPGETPGIWTGEVIFDNQPFHVYAAVNPRGQMMWTPRMANAERRLTQFRAAGQDDVVDVLLADRQHVIRHEMTHAFNSDSTFLEYGFAPGGEEGLVEALNRTIYRNRLGGQRLAAQEQVYGEFEASWTLHAQHIARLSGRSVEEVLFSYWNAGGIAERAALWADDLMKAYVRLGYTVEDAATAAYVQTNFTWSEFLFGDKAARDISRRALGLDPATVSARLGVPLDDALMFEGNPTFLRAWGHNPRVLEPKWWADAVSYEDYKAYGAADDAARQAFTARREVQAARSVQEDWYAYNGRDRATALDFQRRYLAAPPAPPTEVPAWLPRTMPQAQRDEVASFWRSLVDSQPSILRTLTRVHSDLYRKPLKVLMKSGEKGLVRFLGDPTIGRGYKVWKKWERQLKELKSLRAGLEKALTQAGNRYTWNSILVYRAVTKSFASGLAIGDKWKDPGYSWGTIDLAAALAYAGPSGAVLAITLDNRRFLGGGVQVGGTSVLYQQTQNLLPAGLTYTVVGRYVSDGTPIFTVNAE